MFRPSSICFALWAVKVDMTSKTGTKLPVSAFKATEASGRTSSMAKFLFAFKFLLLESFAIPFLPTRPLVGPLIPHLQFRMTTLILN